jgi:hypothetical protein
MNPSAHLNLDNAWEANPMGIPDIDARTWGPRLRYFAPQELLSVFYQKFVAPLPPFVLYGSGDFHHLAGWLIKRVHELVTLICFDNHPDWDIRPPRWSCGGWINRALEHDRVKRAVVWGCGNFELAWPSRLFANRRALRSGRLEVHGWAERYSPGVRKRFDCMTREDWRPRFELFIQQLAGTAVYVTVDLDCLDAQEATSNWEHGLFSAADIAWALRRLREGCRVLAGDVCGAYSPPKFQRWTQRLAGAWDHPKAAAVNIQQSKKRNLAALQAIWPALVGAT